MTLRSFILHHLQKATVQRGWVGHNERYRGDVPGFSETGRFEPIYGLSFVCVEVFQSVQEP